MEPRRKRAEEVSPGPSVQGPGGGTGLVRDRPNASDVILADVRGEGEEW